MCFFMNLRAKLYDAEVNVNVPDLLLITSSLRLCDFSSCFQREKKHVWIKITKTTGVPGEFRDQRPSCFTNAARWLMYAYVVQRANICTVRFTVANEHRRALTVCCECIQSFQSAQKVLSLLLTQIHTRHIPTPVKKTNTDLHQRNPAESSVCISLAQTGLAPKTVSLLKNLRSLASDVKHIISKITSRNTIT